MAKRKFGHDEYGHWVDDPNGLPCYILDLDQIHPLCLPLYHVFGNGMIGVLADHRGQQELFVYNGALPVPRSPLPEPQCRTLAVSLHRGADPFGIACGQVPSEGEARMVWGLGYVEYQMVLPENRGTSPLDFGLSCAIPPEESCGLLEVRLTNRGPGVTTVSVAITMALGIRDDSESRYGTFQQEGVAVLTDAHECLGDLFLAAEPGWQAKASVETLILKREFRLEAGESVKATLVMGYSKTCTLAWLRALLERLTAENIRKDWAEKLRPMQVRAPELWMRQECLWACGRTLSFASASPGTSSRHLVRGDAALFRPGSPLAGQRPDDTVRDLLLLSMPSVFWLPQLAENTLLAVTGAQEPSGRFPQRLSELRPGNTDPARDAGDLEIWFLTSWIHYITVTGDSRVLDHLLPYTDGTLAQLWEHLTSAAEWIRYHLGEGPHGLIRCLAHDANPYLDRCGIAGVGESVLSTAVLCFALQHLITLARQRGETRKVDEWTEWRRRLVVAVEYCYQGAWFRRGYTDSGRAFGDTDSGRAFADVQAWAVLARCGTAQQREQALNSILKASEHGPVRAVTLPFPLAAPADITSWRLPPGTGFNGGVVLRDAAWFLWALASIGKQDQAIKEWQQLTIRCRASQQTGLPAAYLSNLPSWSVVPGSPAGVPGGSGAGIVPDVFPTAHATAWLDFSMRRILEPDVKIPPPSPVRLG